jgi:hypothetical protein
MQTNDQNQDAAPDNAGDNNLAPVAARSSEEIVPPPATGSANVDPCEAQLELTWAMIPEEMRSEESRATFTVGWRLAWAARGNSPSEKAEPHAGLGGQS